MTLRPFARTSRKGSAYFRYLASWAGTAALLGQQAWAGIALTELPYAAAIAPAWLSEITAPKDGCWLNGKWYPEGAKVYPPPNSRIAAPGYSLCKNGKWTYVTTY